MNLVEDFEATIECERVRFSFRKYAYAIAATVAEGRIPSPELLDRYRAAKTAVNAFYGDE